MTKIAFISDIHGNLEAFKAVLENISQYGADMTVCLGDIIGYGPDPQACVDIIREKEIQTVMGNHDEYATLLMDPRVERLRDDVKQSIEWTQAKLSFDALTWLSKLPQSMDAEVFGITHGAFTKNPYHYCRDEESFAENFACQSYQLAFCGHSHQPVIGIQTEDGRVVVDYIRKGRIPETGKVMVNIGSVGQPRDGNANACVVYYELETRIVELVRVPYNVEATMQKLMRSPLPEKFAKRLAIGK